MEDHPTWIEPVLERLDKLETMLSDLIRQRTVKEWYSVDEVAAILNKARFTVREWCRNGRVHCRKPYSLFGADTLQYLLPIRNWGWRSIRRVRARGEEAEYEGFDATARAAFNFICQGGTADISKLMMLRSQPVCNQFGARLLVQIHDELVFEVPRESTTAFMTTMKKVLEQPPVPGFAVPIVVEPKRGLSFGSLETVQVSDSLGPCTRAHAPAHASVIEYVRRDLANPEADAASGNRCGDHPRTRIRVPSTVESV